MVKTYYEQDGNIALLKGKTVGIVGYGSEGPAHALNLRDSGVSVVVGLPETSKSRAKAESAGLRVLSNVDAAKASDVMMVLVPDHIQPDLYEKELKPHLTAGKTLMFAHGFAIHFGFIQPPQDIDVSMIAPKAPGHRVRELFTDGMGVPALVAVHQNVSGRALEQALGYGLGLGCLKAGIIETSFKEEAETDLFGEQAVLCGGLCELIRAGFDTLVKAGYAPEMAYFECLHEVKLIVDLIYEGGIANMNYSISNTAEYGEYVTGPRIVTEETKKEMKRVLDDIQSGKFARDWMLENKVNQTSFKATRAKLAAHPIEDVGAKLRDMMPWIKKGALVDKTKN